MTEFASSVVKAHQLQYSIVFCIYTCLRDLSSDMLSLILEEISDGSFYEYCSGIARCRRSRRRSCRSNSHHDDDSHCNRSSNSNRSSHTNSSITSTADDNDWNGNPLFVEIDDLFTWIVMRCFDVVCNRIQVLRYKISTCQKSVVVLLLTLFSCIIDVATL